jgi:hypothetical protein
MPCWQPLVCHPSRSLLLVLSNFQFPASCEDAKLVSTWLSGGQGIAGPDLQFETQNLQQHLPLVPGRSQHCLFAARWAAAGLPALLRSDCDARWLLSRTGSHHGFIDLKMFFCFCFFASQFEEGEEGEEEVRKGCVRCLCCLALWGLQLSESPFCVSVPLALSAPLNNWTAHAVA